MSHTYFSAALPKHGELAKLESWQRRAMSRSVRRGTVLLGELKHPATVQRVQTLLQAAMATRGLAEKHVYTRGWVRHISKEEFEKGLAAEPKKTADEPPLYAALARDLLHCSRNHAKQIASRDADLGCIASAGTKRPSATVVVTEGPGPEVWPMPKRARNPEPSPAIASLERRRELLRELEDEVNLPARRKSMVAEGIPPLPSSDLTLAQVALYPEANYGHSDMALRKHLREDALLVDPTFASVVEHLVRARETGPATVVVSGDLAPPLPRLC
jgi:hypothetical protein